MHDPADDRHPDEGSDSAGRHRDPGLHRRIGKQSLQPYRQQHQAAIKDEAKQRHQQHAGAVGPVLKYAERYLPDGRLARLHNKRDDKHDCYRQQNHDPVRGEPVLLLPFVEHDLQRANSHREHSHAPVVNPG